MLLQINIILLLSFFKLHMKQEVWQMAGFKILSILEVSRLASMHLAHVMT